ncbi:MAG: glycosyltransferase [Cyclobacteriaceae bacterium]|nr:glycosyltransferase [Cyclobacteriaceae bacterium]
MLVLPSVVFLLYGCLIMLVITGWRKALRRNYPLNRDHPFITILIPVRDEEKNIIILLDDISRQNYPRDLFEVVVIDDHSGDDTVAVVEGWIRHHPEIQLSIILLKDASGKKAALTAGVGAANGEIIITTDADCRAGVHWIQSMADAFGSKVQMVIGPVCLMDNKTLFGRFQQLELMVLSATGMATMALGLPTMCNGANVAFRKSAFLQVGGYTGNENIASGDDEFLLRKIVSAYPNGVALLNNSEGIITTQPSKTWKEFTNQRFRWAGKWRKHGLGFSSLMAFVVFLANVQVPLVMLFFLLGLIPEQSITLILLKVIPDLILILVVYPFFRIRFRLMLFFWMQLVYPFYVVFFGLTANFLPAYWKGRKI